MPASDLSELERELCRIPEISAARIVADLEGRPLEVHILASPEKHAKQVVRDVQSVAMASFGVDLDRRVISVVQLEGTPAPEAEAEREASFNGPSPRHVVDSVTLERSDLRCRARVTLRQGSERVMGEAEGSVSTSGILRAVAQATLESLRQTEPGAARADLETALLVRMGDRLVAVASIVLLVPPYEEIVAGSAVVRAAGEHDAVARAVLDATNRRLARLG